MADMSDVLEVLTSIENYLVDLPTKIILRANQIFIVNGLSDVSENLGIVTAGEFRAGNRNEPGMFLRTAVAGSGFSGMRMRYPAMNYDLDGTPTDWNLVGINDDILQFGVRASDGKLVAGGGAVILDSTGITAVGGTIAGWTIDTTELTNTKIKISSAGSIESIPFVSGVGGTGWKISEEGDVEFNNAVVRGELRTTVLTYQEVQAVAGTMGVFHSAGVLSQDLTLPAVPSGTYQINTKAPNSTNPQIFDNNHILQIKNGTQSTWFIIDGGFGTSGDGYYWLCTYLSGTTDVTYTTGQAVISYGVSGDGFLLMEAIGTGSPYFSVRTHAGAPYTANTEHVRMGNLNGNWGYATDVYGVAIGQYATGKGNITVDPTDGIKINIYTDNIMQFNSSGAFITNVLNMSGDDAAIAIGNPPPASAVSGTGIWLDRNGLYSLASNVYQVKIDAVDGKLYAGGGNVILDNRGILLNTDNTPHQYPLLTATTDIKWKTAAGVPITKIGTYYLSTANQSALYITHELTNSNYSEILLTNKTSTIYSTISVGAHITLSPNNNVYIDRGRLIIPFGTKANPSLKFDSGSSGGVGDGGGLYGLGVSDGIGISVGGIEKARFTANGQEIINGGLYVGRGADAGAGNIAYTGALKSYKNSTEYTGYIFIPLTTPILVTNGITAGTFHYTTTSYGIPSGAKAVALYSGGRWSTANNSYYSAVYYYNSTSIAFSSFSSAVANMNGYFNTIVPLDSSGRFTHVMSANMVVQYIYILGYWI